MAIRHILSKEEEEVKGRHKIYQTLARGLM